MIKVCGKNFTCDECPICEGMEHRLETAAELGVEPQIDHCGCDKVQIVRMPLRKCQMKRLTDRERPATLTGVKCESGSVMS